jgi:hypothetical protein
MVIWDALHGAAGRDHPGPSVRRLDRAGLLRRAW